MEAATVARRPAATAAAAAPAAAPSRAPAKRPRSRPAPGKRSAPRRKKATARSASAAAPARRKASTRKAPTRKAPTRKAPGRSAPGRIHGGQLIPIAVGTAARVRQLPDSGLVVRLTQGRAWIAVLGVLLVGIVALNVMTLSVAAGAGHVDENVQALEKENSILGGRVAAVSGAARVRHEAGALGLAMSDVDDVKSISIGPEDAAVAAERLGTAGTGY